MKIPSLANSAGSCGDVPTWVLKLLVSVCCVISLADTQLADAPFERLPISPAISPSATPAIPDLPLPADMPRFHRKHFTPYKAPQKTDVAQSPPIYNRFVASGCPPPKTHFSKPSVKKNALSPGTGLVDIAPAQPRSGSLPADISQPPLSPRISSCCKPDTVLKRGTCDCHCVYPIKLDILLLNVSGSPNWNFFLDEFSSQLGLRVSQIELIDFYVLSLSRMNISMDITPHTGISFSENRHLL